MARKKTTTFADVTATEETPVETVEVAEEPACASDACCQKCTCWGLPSEEMQWVREMLIELGQMEKDTTPGQWGLDSNGRLVSHTRATTLNVCEGSTRYADQMFILACKSAIQRLMALVGTK